MIGESGNDSLFGGQGNDIIEGRAGNDAIFGNKGDDQLTGGTGQDTLDGGSGANSLTGGSGQDVFRYSNTAETRFDFFTDFSFSEDLIQVAGGITQAEALAAYKARTSYEFQTGTVFSTDSGAVILLGVDPNSISSSDFLGALIVS